MLVICFLTINWLIKKIQRFSLDWTEILCILLISSIVPILLDICLKEYSCMQKYIFTAPFRVIFEKSCEGRLSYQEKQNFHFQKLLSCNLFFFANLQVSWRKKWWKKWPEKGSYLEVPKSSSFIELITKNIWKLIILRRK